MYDTLRNRLLVIFGLVPGVSRAGLGHTGAVQNVPTRLRTSETSKPVPILIAVVQPRTLCYNPRRAACRRCQPANSLSRGTTRQSHCTTRRSHPTYRRSRRTAKLLPVQSRVTEYHMTGCYVCNWCFSAPIGKGSNGCQGSRASMESPRATVIGRSKDSDESQVLAGDDKIVFLQYKSFHVSINFSERPTKLLWTSKKLFEEG